MKIVTPSFYKDFECIAGDCPDSCCQGWEVDADIDSLEYYKTLSGDIKQRIHSVLDKDEFGNTIFRLTDRKRCPFLNDSNLCDMHIAIGGEHTPFTCRTFPRFINDFGSTREMGLSFSCPVASDMMWNLEGEFDFETTLNSDPPSLNDIDAELYFYLIKARNKVYQIVKNKELPLNERIIQLLKYAQKLQNDIDSYEEGGAVLDFKDVFNNPEVINNEWVEKVKNGSFDKSAINSKSCENIAVYFLFRYFMQAVYDRDVLSKVKTAAVGVLIPAFFGNDSWTIHLWSKETEHSDVNMERYVEILRNDGVLSVENLIKYFI
uniref:flagellin lysine-N-methylase n=1 Tax=Eubacterium sp. TaxID=142586 RepID=UPI00402A1D6E